MMSPQDKALELMAKFNDAIPMQYAIDETMEDTCRKMDIDFKATKDCALIAVNEMLSNAGLIWGFKYSKAAKESRDIYTEYWQQVKEAIENINKP